MYSHPFLRFSNVTTMKALKILAVLILLVCLFALAVASYVKFLLPDIKVKELTIDINQERVNRGRYMANHVMLCIDCHSRRDFTKYSGPTVAGTEGMGGELFDQRQGFPGRYYATNITPYELRGWTDGELYRALTAGVGKRNNALFPIMPYHIYGRLDDEDIYSVIAYLRTIPEIKSEVSNAVSDFPMNFIINTMPKVSISQKRPPKDDLVGYGEYMTLATNCMECHTEADDMGQLMIELAYAGGRKFFLPSGELSISTNITPDDETGIGKWDEEKFIRAFKANDLTISDPTPIIEGDFNTIMPWTAYAGLDTFDIRAIYHYLRSLEPIEKITPVE